MSLSLEIELPGWLAEMAAGVAGKIFGSAEEKMAFAISLARQNVERKSGGPFGAAIFHEETGELVSVGVNSVVEQHASIAHAETMAVALAQKRLRSHDLASDCGKTYGLYTSGQPCIMCYGVIWWSGLTRLVCAARTEDIEQIAGFREGPLPENWKAELSHRPGLPDVEVIPDFMRSEACEVLRAYAASGLPIYNAGADLG